MNQHEQWAHDMVKMIRGSFEAGIKNMEAFQAQAEQAINVALSSSGEMQQELRHSFDSWLKTVNEARQVYVDAIKDGLDSMERQFNKE